MRHLIVVIVNITNAWSWKSRYVKFFRIKNKLKNAKSPDYTWITQIPVTSEEIERFSFNLKYVNFYERLNEKRLISSKLINCKFKKSKLES